jgi:sodium-coupled monocarboxylate transporter 8/12
MTSTAAGLGLLDYGVLVVYLAASVLIGAFSGKREKSFDAYCVANRRIPWWAACVSIVATDLSGISYMGTPAWMYQHDLKYNFGIILMPLVMLAVVLIFVPVFYRAGVYTIYQYLEVRFHTSARTITAILFLIKGFIHLGGAIYIPSLALTAVTGVPLWACILIIGLSTTLYTMKGGMHAVIWTDLMQFMVLSGGLLFMIALAMSGLGWDFGKVWHTAGSLTAPATQTPYTTLVDWRFDLRTESTVWAIIVFYFIFNMGTYGTDQVAVQRYFTVKSFGEVAKSVIGAGFVNVISVAMMAGLGLVLVVYYRARPELAATLPKTDMLVPHFVVHVMPAGAKGVIFAAIFAATMSCVSAGLNSFATVGTVDLYKRLFRPTATDQHYVFAVKLMTCLGGVITTLLAFWISFAKTTIVETINSLVSIFIGPITAMFFLGVLTRRTNISGLLSGVFLGLAAGAILEWTPLRQQVSWMWFAPIGCLVTFTSGYLASFLPQSTRSPQRTYENVSASAAAE